jgi:hypothetical protein
MQRSQALPPPHSQAHGKLQGQVLDPSAPRLAEPGYAQEGEDQLY